MRLLQIRVPEDERGALLDTIRERDLGYTILEGGAEQDDQLLVQVIVPADAVEHVLADLVEAGYERESFTVSLEAEFASFENIDEVQNRWAKTPTRIAPAALRSKAKDMQLNTRSYVWMMVLSAIVATAGLVVGSPAVVVGAMVIAPIVSPMLTASVGTVRDDREMLLDSVHQQLFGLAVATLAAVAFAAFLKHTLTVPTALDINHLELTADRLSPGILSIMVGLVAGAAGAYGLATKGNVTIVGVMIAAALIPTASTAGIGFAWGEPVIGVGALILLMVVILAVNVGGYLMLVYLGYRPDEVDEGLFDPVTGTEALVVGATVIVIVAILVPVGVGAYQQSSFERSVNEVTTDTLDQQQYSELSIRGISMEYTGIGGGDGPTNVTITLSRTNGDEFPDLPDVLDRRITAATGTEVVVRLTYVDYDQSNTSTTDDPVNLNAYDELADSGANKDRSSTDASPTTG